MSGPLLQVRSLRVTHESGRVLVLGVDLTMRKGESLALLGASGAGKSLTALALLGLSRAGCRLGGSVRVGGEELLGASQGVLAAARGRRIAMVFQEPASALNPAFTVASHLYETLAQQLDLSGKAARQRALSLLSEVGFAGAHERLGAYPFELSGGERQRLMLALALAGDPEVLVADEPTTALDVTLQAQLLALLCRLREARGMALILVTHNLLILPSVVERVVLMDAGSIVEKASVADFLASPQHPLAVQLVARAQSAEEIFR